MSQPIAITTADDILARLAEPFAVHEVQWKPGATAGGKAMALPFVNASAIQERLDAVLGASWEARYDFLEGGAVLCCLRVRIGDEWHERCDVGQCGKGGENATKQGVSDAFKRAARAWGLGRYLTRVPRQWVSYDTQHRRFSEQPRLPAWALPTADGKPAIAITTPARPIGIPADATIPAQDLEDEDPPAVRISDQQEKQLVQLLRETRADVQRFLLHFSVRAVGQLEAKDFGKAMSLLRQKAAAAPGGPGVTSQARNVPANGVAPAKGSGKH